MSQKNGKFQSKTKRFGGDSKFSKPGGAKRGFSKKFEGDREDRLARDFGSSERRDGKFGGGSRGFKGQRRDDRGPRDDSRGSGRPEGGRGGFKSRRDGDFEGGSRGFKGGFKGDRKGGFGDDSRSGFKKDYKPRKTFGDEPRRGFGRGKSEGFERDGKEGYSRGFDKPRGRSFEGKSFGDRKFGDKKFGGKKFGPKKDRDFDRPFRERDSEQPREASLETKQKLKSDRQNYGAPSAAFLYGVHPVSAAVTNPNRSIKRILVTESGYNSLRPALEEAAAAGITRPEPVFVDKEDIDRLAPRDAVHQDILADVEELEEVFLTDIINAADENTKVIVLDQVTDPHNIGAILRTAAAFGAVAVIVQKLHAPDITGVLAKSASGAVEYVPLVREVNLSRALAQLKEAGFYCMGLDERGSDTVAKLAPKGRVALVMGAEGDGLRRLVAENCDVLAKLPTDGPILSLNVSNATAVALYELIRK